MYLTLKKNNHLSEFSRLIVKRPRRKPLNIYFQDGGYENRKTKSEVHNVTMGPTLKTLIIKIGQAIWSGAIAQTFAHIQTKKKKKKEKCKKVQQSKKIGKKVKRMSSLASLASLTHPIILQYSSNV